MSDEGISKTAILKWLARLSGLDRLFKKVSVFLADRFYNLQRRALIILLFFTFVCLGDGLGKVYTDFSRAYLPRWMWTASVRAAVEPVIFTTSTNTVSANAIVPASGTNSTNSAVFDPSSTNGQSVFIRIENDLHHVDWFHLFWRYIWVILSWVLWLLLAILISLAITGIADHAAKGGRANIQPESQTQTTASPSAADAACTASTQQGLALEESVHDLAKLLNRTGIKTIFDPKQGKDASEQPYAEAVRFEVSRSKTLKLLTIAGYQYIGKGQDSLLYNVIKSNQSIKCEVVLLNPQAGSPTVKERLADLKERDETYTSEKLVQQIEATKAILVQFKHTWKKEMKLWHTPNHPVFRLLILDDCLFVSTYAKGHGHESPVYQIVKDVKNSDGASWFDSFVKVFENVKSSSNLVHLG